jgi:DeoR family transcriptional regulator, suf operon transcriptional repressor
MLDAFGERQQELLKLLLKRKQGLTIDEVAGSLRITRPAARQHLIALDHQGYVERGELLNTGGRPGQTYKLSAKGYGLFPKQYSWFSEVLLESLEKELGEKGLHDLMKRLGQEVASQAKAQVPGPSLPEKVQQTAKLMNDLAYQAETTFTGKEQPGSPPVIEAHNCVYHALATQFPQVCQFDLALLSTLTGAQIIHEQCIIRGGGVCRFRFKAKP